MRLQIIIAVAGISAIIILFQLPKSIINKTDKNKLSAAESNTTINALPSESIKAITSTEKLRIAALTKKFYSGDNLEKRYIFADSLVDVFITLDKYDSAAKYADELVLLHKQDVTSHKWAGNLYYKLFTAAQAPTVANEFAAKVQMHYKKVLDKHPNDAEVKCNLAMTYVISENPMQAVMMLRDVLQQNPNFEPAIFNLGLLSLQSGQTDKAIERFNKLRELNPRNWKAQLYLATALLDKNEVDKAQVVLKQIISLANEPETVAHARQLLGEKN